MKPNLVETIGRAVAASILLAMLAGCGGGGPPQPEPARPTTLTITDGNNQSGAVGESLPSPLVVRVNDQTGKPMPGATVRWSVTSGGGTVDHASSSTGSDGTASAHWTLGTKAGANSLAAATGALTPVSFTATGAAGPLASITIGPPSDPVETGDLVQLSLAGADTYGNVVSLPPFTWTFTWTSSDSNIAKVTADGFLVALGPGVALISASYGAVAGSLSLTINAGITFSFGPEETVFAWSTDRCEDLDIPDAPAHAARLADGSLLLVGGHESANYVMTGTDFSSLRRRCSPAMTSHNDPYPESFDNNEWLSAIYRDGEVIYALIHNEYHDPFTSNCISASWPDICWYNSVTSAFSLDNGLTFTHATAPAHVVAPPPVRWDPTGTPPPHGYFNPSNIVQGPDNFYYSFFMAVDRSRNPSLCVMRTQTLGDPTSWRAWDGTGFSLQMTSPYTGPAPASCTSVVYPPDVVPQPTVTYNAYLEKYMLVGGTAWGGPTEFVCGFSYSLSPDLIHWTPKRLLRPANSPSLSGCWPPESTTKAYPSIIDHNDTTVNFEGSGQTPYLYFTRFNDPYLNRDLVRVPMTITAH